MLGAGRGMPESRPKAGAIVLVMRFDAGMPSMVVGIWLNHRSGGRPAVTPERIAPRPAADGRHGNQTATGWSGC